MPEFGTCRACGNYVLLQPDCPTCGTIQFPDAIDPEPEQMAVICGYCKKTIKEGKLGPYGNPSVGACPPCEATAMAEAIAQAGSPAFQAGFLEGISHG